MKKNIIFALCGVICTYSAHADYCIAYTNATSQPDNIDVIIDPGQMITSVIIEDYAPYYDDCKLGTRGYQCGPEAYDGSGQPTTKNTNSGKFILGNFSKEAQYTHTIHDWSDTDRTLLYCTNLSNIAWKWLPFEYVQCINTRQSQITLNKNDNSGQSKTVYYNLDDKTWSDNLCDQDNGDSDHRSGGGDDGRGGGDSGRGGGDDGRGGSDRRSGGGDDGRGGDSNDCPSHNSNNTENNTDCCEDEPLNTAVIAAMDVLNTFNHNLKASVWVTADGKFNTARMGVDAASGAVLATISGLISNSIIKKNQLAEGMEGYHCTVGNERVADHGDQFTIGFHN